MRRIGLLGALLCLAACGAPKLGGHLTARSSSPRPSPKTADYPHHTAVFHFNDAAITESSGIISSTISDEIFFTHNDSGDSARFFAVDVHGCTVARYNLIGGRATDWEDIAHSRGTDGNEVIWLGDIGDNNAVRASVEIYEVDQPVVSPTSGTGACPPPAERYVNKIGFKFVYSDGQAHNAETLMAVPITGQLYVVTKGTEPGYVPTLYSAPLPLVEGAVNTLQLVTKLHVSDLVTGGDISPDGKRLVLRTYLAAYEWQIPAAGVPAAFDSTPIQIRLPLEPQGEGIGYSRDGQSLYISSEDPFGTSPPVYRLSN